MVADPRVDSPASVAGMRRFIGTPRFIGTARFIWVATAGSWALASALLLAARSGAPPGLLDAAATLAYIAGWLLLAPAIILATRLVPAPAARVLGTAIAAGAILAGVANLLGSVASVDGLSTWYVDGIVLATILLVPLAYLFARARSNALAVVALAVFLGVGFVAGPVGWLLVAAAFAALAYRPAWFRPRPRPRLPDMPTETSEPA